MVGICHYYRQLEEKLLLLEQSSHNNSNDESIATLQERCLTLQQQVEEMEVSNASCLHCSTTP